MKRKWKIAVIAVGVAVLLPVVLLMLDRRQGLEINRQLNIKLRVNGASVADVDGYIIKNLCAAIQVGDSPEQVERVLAGLYTERRRWPSADENRWDDYYDFRYGVMYGFTFVVGYDAQGRVRARGENS